MNSCVELLKKNDVSRTAQLQGIKFEDLSFDGLGTVSGGKKAALKATLEKFAALHQEVEVRPVEASTGSTGTLSRGVAPRCVVLA